jgi:hypothetical protein
MKLKITTAIVLLLLMVSCQTVSKMDWEGKWMNAQNSFGFEIKNGKIIELDKGPVRPPTEVDIVKTNKGFNWIIQDRGKAVILSVERIDSQRIRLTAPNGEVLVLEKE